MKTEQEIQEYAEKILANNVDGLKELIKDDDFFHFYKGVVIQYGIGMAEWMQEQHDWVSVEDRLPKVGKKYKESDCVLGFEKDINKPVVCWYDSKDGWIVSHYKANSSPIQITHWQPLPKNPKINRVLERQRWN